MTAPATPTEIDEAIYVDKASQYQAAIRPVLILSSQVSTPTKISQTSQPKSYNATLDAQIETAVAKLESLVIKMIDAVPESKDTIDFAAATFRTNSNDSSKTITASRKGETISKTALPVIESKDEISKSRLDVSPTATRADIPTNSNAIHHNNVNSRSQMTTAYAALPVTKGVEGISKSVSEVSYTSHIPKFQTNYSGTDTKLAVSQPGRSTARQSPPDIEVAETIPRTTPILPFSSFTIPPRVNNSTATAQNQLASRADISTIREMTVIVTVPISMSEYELALQNATAVQETEKISEPITSTTPMIPSGNQSCRSRNTTIGKRVPTPESATSADEVE